MLQEVVVTNAKASLSQSVSLPDYQFGSLSLMEQRRYVVSLLLAQLELASAVCMESPAFGLLRKRLLIIHRILYALHSKFHDRESLEDVPCVEAGPTPKPSTSRGGSITHVTIPPAMDTSIGSRSGTDSLVELGVRTGLKLLFNILKLHWSLDSTQGAQASLCNDVLKTAADVLWTLPPMSLANDRNIPRLGAQSLLEVSTFLKETVMPTSGAHLESRILGAEILLALALQRGSLQFLLEWIEMALRCCATSSPDGPLLFVTRPVLISAIAVIRQRPVQEVELIADSLVPNESMDIYNAAVLLMQELVEMSTKSSSIPTSLPLLERPSSTSGFGIPTTHNCAALTRALGKESQQQSMVYVWGSNSSYQLGEAGPDRILHPRKATTFADIESVEAGQYCTFAVNSNGTLSACGKGCYGRLGLGDSSNQPVPKQLPINSDVKFRCVSSSKGSDGHTLALTHDGTIFSWGDGDYGKLGHGGVATEKFPKQIQGALTGKNVICISAGFRHSACVTDSGELYTWGEGESGRLGLGDTNDRQVS